MLSNIRNFVIIAHIDHGKSTLADRFLEVTGTVEARQMKPQFLDQLELERERGITIKMAPVRMAYTPSTTDYGLPTTAREDKFAVDRRLSSVDISQFILNLIDTPGHSDFSYEVSRALQAVEGAVLLVDATQGIQAQTLVNFRLAQKAGLTIIGAINKIDIANLDPEYVRAMTDEMAGLLGVTPAEIFRVSGKTGQGVRELLDAVVQYVPAPAPRVSSLSTGIDGSSAPATEDHLRSRLADSDKNRRPSSASLRELPYESKETRQLRVMAHDSKTDQASAGSESFAQNHLEKKSGNNSVPQALIFDSLYDEHKGVVAFVRVFHGEYKAGNDAALIMGKQKFKIKEVGYFSPKMKASEALRAGEIGFIATGIKDPHAVRIGDTIGPVTGAIALPGYAEPTPVVFVSLYPDEAEEYEDVRQALLKLKLNDSSLTFESDFNEVLGRGFKCGFLGQLHFEITSERLEKEFNLTTVSTFPSVAYRVRVFGAHSTSKRTDRSSAPAAEDDLRSPQPTVRRTSDYQASAGSESFSTKQNALSKGAHERNREEHTAREYITIENVEHMPDEFVEVQEPIIRIEIITPMKFLGNVLQLKGPFRMQDIETTNLEHKMLITATMPLSSLISDFDGELKSVSEGMASFSYEIKGYATADVAKVVILVAGEPVPGLTRLMYKDTLEEESRAILFKLKDILPKQQFVQALQAQAGNRIVARENIAALKKDVTGYLYGGDRTRKMKLWKKQQRGKKRLKETGRVTLSASHFKELLKK